MPVPIGELLLKEKRISAEQLQQALSRQKANGGKLGQNLVQIYSDASKAVSVDFAWSPWFAFVNDNFNKQVDGLFAGKMTAKEALEAWQNESLKNARDNGFDVK